MNHYQKLATLFIRLVAMILGVICVVVIGISIIQEHLWFALSNDERIKDSLLDFLFYFVPCVIVYLLAPVMGRFVGRDMAE